MKYNQGAFMLKIDRTFYLNVGAPCPWGEQVFAAGKYGAC